LPEAPDTGLPPAAPAEISRGEGGLFTVPNVITLLRLCAVPVTVWLVIQRRLDLAFLLFVGAGISDAVDGWWARVRNARSFLGAVLDPVADKALLVSIYVALAVVGVLPDWLAILVVFRDLLIVGGVLVLALMGTAPAIRPIPISKVNTFAQIALAGLALLLEGFALPSGWLLPTLIWIVAGTTIASGAAYVRSAARGTTG
jgi:cardiolipin synthase